MAGLRDEVELDVAAALRDIDRIGAALTQQTQRFRKDLAASFDGLRTASPKIDGTGVEKARRSTRGLAEDVNKVTKATEGATAATGKYGRVLQSVAQIRVVQGLVAFFGGRALIDQIQKTSKAYADLVQEVARAEQVFGDADRQILNFGDAAVGSLGLARREAIQAASDFGTMFRDAGLSGQQAALLSTQFVKLGADLSAFANIGVPEALLKLSSGLAGEIEPLRRIGFAIGQTATEAKALELGMEKVNGAFTQGQLTQARAAVILEKLALVNGQFARESEGLIGQQARLRAEAEQLREELGEQLQPVMLELVHAARDNLPVFGELATNIIPLLISALRVLNPTAQVFLQILTLLSPLITTLGQVLDAIPAPLLQIAGAFLLVNRFIVPLSKRGGPLDALGARLLYAGDAIAKLGSRQGIAAAFSGLNPVALGATAAIVGLTAVFQQHRNEQLAMEKAIDDTSRAFLDQADAVAKDARASTLKRIEDQNQIDDLRELGLSVAEFARLAVSGQAGVDALVSKMAELGGNNGLRLISDQYATVAEAVAAYGNVSAAVAAGVIEGNEGLVLSLFRLNKELQGAAKRALDLAVVNESLSQKQADTAIDAATVNGVTDWYQALLAVEPALAAAIIGAEGLGAAGTETTSALDELDDSLKRVRDSLDSTFGRFLDAEEATIRLRSSAHDLAEALGEGARKGESLVDFQERLRTSTLDVARAVEDRALALARAGEIEATEAGVQAEMKRQLEELVALFPELAGQLQGYIDLLNDVPKTVTTKVVTIFEEKGLTTTAASEDARERAARDRSAGAGTARAFADGIGAGLDEIADAGREAGRVAAEEAAKEIETTLRRSGRAGLNLGGFIVEGIELGARRAEVDLRNFINGMTDGLTGVVNEAMKIDASEASEILQAVEAADQAARDLADARKELGADSIEAAVAELVLADRQRTVNDLILEAIDSTKAYNEQLQKTADAIDAVTGSLSALQRVRDAREAAKDAAEGLGDAQERLGLFNRLIDQQTAKLEDARRRRIAAGGTAPSDEERRIQASITDLDNRRIEQLGVVADAQADVDDAQLSLIDSTRALLDLAPQLAAAQGMWEGLFRSIAAAAGLSAAAIDDLVRRLGVAGGLVQGVAGGILTGTPTLVPNVPGTKTALPSGYGTAGTGKVNYNTFNIYETTGPRNTAVAVVDEQRAVELMG